MMIGVGLYAPCMALVGALGMNIGVAFPIMMGSCAFLMNASCFKFIKEGKYDRTATIVLSIFGCIGVVIAYKVKLITVHIDLYRMCGYDRHFRNILPRCAENVYTF